MNKKFFWNCLSINYDKNAEGTLDFYNTIAKKISEHLLKDSYVLEVATGTGILAEKIAPYCKSVEATDFSEKMIAQALKKPMPDNINFSTQDVNSLNFSDNTFDAVIILYALHVIPNTENVLKSIRKVLKQGGVLIAPCVVEDNMGANIFMKAAMKIMNFTLWKYDEYLELFRENGWTVIESEHLTQNTSTAYVVAVPV